MIEAHWLLFLIASVAVIATPGQGMILVMSRSITYGAPAGVASAAGVSVGLVGHTLLAAAGLGVLLQASKIAGADHPTATVAVLGLVFAALTFAIKGPVALFAGRLSAWFRARPMAMVWLHRFSGLVLVGLAVRLALARRE
jgi:threonine/homoserine/homoserine lactone efflux protein